MIKFKIEFMQRPFASILIRYSMQPKYKSKKTRLFHAKIIIIKIWNRSSESSLLMTS